VVVAGPLITHHGTDNHGNDDDSSDQGVVVPLPAGRGGSNNHGIYKAKKERGRGRSNGYQLGRGLGVGVRDSSLPQLVQEIQEKLLKDTAECLICFEMILRSAPVWSCSICYSIFHLSCIKKWAKAPNAIDLSVSLRMNQEPNWRCPGCRSVKFIPSKEIRYACFCGKRTDPPSDLYLIPHSCGEPCGKPLKRKILVGGGNRDDLCPHTCVLQCHPGPCPTCKAFAPPRLCPCGKKTITTSCSDRRSVLTCGQPCGKLLECGRHHCKRICHLGHNLSGVVRALKVSCGQTCGAPRRNCLHTCMAPCHPSSPCPDILCEFPVTITCHGRITAKVPCYATRSSSNYNADAIHEASIIRTLPVPLQLVDADDKKVPLGQIKSMLNVLSFNAKVFLQKLLTLLLRIWIFCFLVTTLFRIAFRIFKA